MVTCYELGKISESRKVKDDSNHGGRHRGLELILCGLLLVPRAAFNSTWKTGRAGKDESACIRT